VRLVREFSDGVGDHSGHEGFGRGCGGWGSHEMYRFASRALHEDEGSGSEGVVVSSHSPKSRVAVPEHVRLRLRDMPRAVGSIRKTIEALQCSFVTFEDATAEGGSLRPETLAKLCIKLEEWSAHAEAKTG